MHYKIYTNKVGPGKLLLRFLKFPLTYKANSIILLTWLVNMILEVLKWIMKH